MKYNRIRDVLEQQGRTQAWLSRQLGISRNGINKLASNATQPSIRRLFDIAKVLQVSPCKLLLDKAEPKEAKE